MKGKYKFAEYNPSTITIYNQDREVLLKEPSLFAVNTQTNCILAVGEEAQRVRGQVKDMIIVSPLKYGVVADFELAGSMLKYFLHKANGRKLLICPQIAVCVPVNMTQVEHKALYEAILYIGAKKVLIIEESFERAIQDIPYSYKIIIEISPETDKQN